MNKITLTPAQADLLRAMQANSPRPISHKVLESLVGLGLVILVPSLFADEITLTAAGEQWEKTP